MTQTVRQTGAGMPVRSRPVQANRLTTFSHAVAFVLGFTVIFTLLGSAIGLLGRSLDPYMPVVQKLGAILLVIFALVTLGVFRWAADTISRRSSLTENPAAAALVNVLRWFNELLYTERRVTEMHNVKRGWGYLSSFLLGVSFCAGWVPCIGPILSSIFVVAMDSNTAWQGAWMLAVYSLGLGIPFLITGLAFTQITPLLRRLNRHANIISIISAVFLLLVAVLLWSQQLGRLTNTFAGLNDLVFAIEDQLGLMSGAANGVSGLGSVGAALLAFSAGLISFISPCVLPLVPAYIGFMTSAAVGTADAS